MEKDKEQALEYFKDQFRNMYLDNLEDQIRSIDKYRGYRGYKGSVVKSKKGGHRGFSITSRFVSGSSRERSGRRRVFV